MNNFSAVMNYNLDLKKELDVQKKFLHCMVQLIILRIEAAPYLLPHLISQRHSILSITTNYMVPN